jgi:tryptophan synthase alpha subunit
MNGGMRAGRHGMNEGLRVAAMRPPPQRAHRHRLQRVPLLPPQRAHRRLDKISAGEAGQFMWYANHARSGVVGPRGGTTTGSLLS